MTTVAITGNTYPVKDQLKALGARWNAAAKAWMVAADRADEARRIVASAPRSSARPSYSRPSWSRGGGKWNGCSMGCRQGAPNPRCKTCCFDHDDW